MIRQRSKKDPLNIVRNLDAFPKIPEEYQVGTVAGGIFSILSRLLIIVLLYNEITWYMDSKLVFKFKPDQSMDQKLKIHLDMTIASPCNSLGADILDATNQNVFSFGILEEEPAWWDLCPTQRAYFEYTQHMNGYMREEYHSLAHIIFKGLSAKGDHKVATSFPERTDHPQRPYDACRIHGSFTLNKVAGNFHIIAGKSLHFPRGHVHITSMLDDHRLNFSHRINRWSFGDASSGIVHPLEGDEKILTDSKTISQYFIEVVPTEVESFMSSVETFQYSVKENIRPINHDQGSHGIPGIYFKYDMSALKVLVLRDREHLFKFIVRLSSTIAGIIVISGFLNSFLQYNCNFLFGTGNNNETTKSNRPSVPSNVLVQPSSKVPLPPVSGAAPANLLFSNAVSGEYSSDFQPLNLAKT